MSHLTPGTRIGPYEILAEIGRGGMGIVYKAMEPALHRVVAIKVLPGHLSEQPEYLDRFRQEARAVAQLNHPNVVTIYQIGESGGLHYIAMEYLQGRELARILAVDGSLEPGRALAVARQIAAALAAAHEVGIVHRDIKPQNVMVDDAGRAKVMDFGVAKLGAAASRIVTTEGSLLGTPAYMAPEQFCDTRVDGRCDLYALGVVLYRCLTGQTPFEAETPAAVMYRVLNDPPPLGELRGRFPPPLVDLLERALAKDPDARFQTGAEMRDAIDRILAAGATAPPPRALSDQTTAIFTRAELLPHSDGAEGGLPAAARAAFLRLSLRARLGAGLAAGALLGAVLLALLRSGPSGVEPTGVPAPSPAADASRVALVRVTPAPPGNAPASGATPRDAIALFTGTGGLVDEGQARAVLIRTAAEGDAVAQMWSAWFHRTGRCGFERDEARVRELAAASMPAIRERAASGDTDAQFLLGVALAEGMAAAPNPEEGLAWIKRAAEAGNTVAMTELGERHQPGDGVAANAGLAMLWFQKAADAGDVIAIHHLGGIYLNNSDVKGADTMALSWFRYAAQAGDAASMTSLAGMLEQGRGVEANPAEALRWYEEAARRGDAQAQTRLRNGDLRPNPPASPPQP